MGYLRAINQFVKEGGVVYRQKKGGRKRAVSPQCEVRLKMATADVAIMRLTAQPHCKNLYFFSNVAPKILENAENAQKKKSDPKSPGLP